MNICGICGTVFSVGNFHSCEMDRDPASHPIIQVDDGTMVHLDSWSGGADPDGAYSHLVLRIERPGQEPIYRYYTDDAIGRVGQSPVDSRDSEYVAAAVGLSEAYRELQTIPDDLDWDVWLRRFGPAKEKVQQAYARFVAAHAAREGR